VIVVSTRMVALGLERMLEAADDAADMSVVMKCGRVCDYQASCSARKIISVASEGRAVDQQQSGVTMAARGRLRSVDVCSRNHGVAAGDGAKFARNSLQPSLHHSLIRVFNSLLLLCLTTVPHHLLTLNTYLSISLLVSNTHMISDLTHVGHIGFCPKSSTRAIIIKSMRRACIIISPNEV
jgi:hypothetical protein